MINQNIIIAILAINSMIFANANMNEKIKIQNTEVVKLAAQELTSQLPQQIDKYTKLINIIPKDETLIYNYELNVTNKSDDEIKKEDRSRMKKAVTTGICNSSERFLKNGINISYIYKSAKSKIELFRFDVTKNDCVKK